MNDNQQNEDGSIFDLNMDDGDLLSLIQGPLTDSENYWNNEQKLDIIRRNNMNLWLPNHWKDKDIFDYQEDNLYQDNRIFVSVETTISILNARIPTADVMPAQDTITSEQIAKDLSKCLYAHAAKYQTLDVFRVATRNLLLKRIGIIKLRFDKSIGKHGEIVAESIPPEDIIVDKDARLGDTPRFIAQKIKDKTVEELLSMFPESEQTILELAGVRRRNGDGNLVAYKSQLAKKKNIYEVWFTYLEKKKPASGLAWVDENFRVILGKERNPNWNYEEEEGYAGNFLDNPMPPFIPVNYLNDGTSYIDQTSMVEQAAPLQRILDRRGFQIMENADQAGGGLVFNTNMISKDDIVKLVGAPDERIGVMGSVRDAVTRIAPPPLPSYVLEDKYDARKEIDAIFATHDVTRGERSGNKTLGQDQMQRDQNYTRMDDIGRAIERAATQYNRYMVQMMKVYYTEDHYFRLTGEDGQFDYAVMRQDLIEDGMDVQVTTGSMQPINKDRQMNMTKDLIQLRMIDPLSVYEVAAGGTLPAPSKMLERFLLYSTDPIAFLGKTKQDDISREAFMDIQVLNRATMPKPRDEYTPEYIKYLNEYMLTGDFTGQPGIVKQMYSQHMQIVMQVAAQQLAALESQMPTQDDMAVANRKAVEQAQMEQQISGGGQQQQQPPKGQPGKPGESGKPAEEVAKQPPQPMQAPQV